MPGWLAVEAHPYHVIPLSTSRKNSPHWPARPFRSSKVHPGQIWVMSLVRRLTCRCQRLTCPLLLVFPTNSCTTSLHSGPRSDGVGGPLASTCLPPTGSCQSPRLSGCRLEPSEDRARVTWSDRLRVGAGSPCRQVQGGPGSPRRTAGEDWDRVTKVDRFLGDRVTRASWAGGRGTGSPTGRSIPWGQGHPAERSRRTGSPCRTVVGDLDRASWRAAG